LVVCGLIFLLLFSSRAQSQNSQGMKLNALEYLEYKGVNVMLARLLPRSHQGGVGVIQNGLRSDKKGP
jgi:endoglucanase